LYIDVPVEVGYKRLQSRKKVTELEHIMEAENTVFGFEIYKNMYDKFQIFYRLLNTLNQQQMICDVVRLDGERLAGDNVASLEELLRKHTV